MSGVVPLIRVENANGVETHKSAEAVEQILSGAAKLAPVQNEPPFELLRQLEDDLGRIERFGPRLHESEVIAEAIDGMFDGARLKPSVLLEVELQNAVSIEDRILDCLTGLNGSRLMSQIKATVAHHRDTQPLRSRMSPGSLQKLRKTGYGAIERERYRPLKPEWKDFNGHLSAFSSRVLAAGVAGVRDGRVFVVDLRKSTHTLQSSINRRVLGSGKVAVWFARQLLPSSSPHRDKRDVVDEIAGWMIEVVEFFLPDRQVSRSQLIRVGKRVFPDVIQQRFRDAVELVSQRVPLPDRKPLKERTVNDNEISALKISRKYSFS